MKKLFLFLLLVISIGLFGRITDDPPMLDENSASGSVLIKQDDGVFHSVSQDSLSSSGDKIISEDGKTSITTQTKTDTIEVTVNDTVVARFTADGLDLLKDLRTSHIEATGSQMLFNLKPPADAVDGQKVVWSFVINDSLPVMQIGTTANDSGGVYADSTSIWQIDPAHVTAYVSASDTTTCATADTYYTLQATFTNKSIKGFTVDSTGVTHLGAKERTFSIVGDWGGSADANNTTVRIALYKNGSLVAGSESPATLCRVAGEAYVTGINTTVDLKAGDKITIVLKADGAGDIITTNDFPIQIEPL